jgi:NifB/MoaA-like Fe-S oxidoreductase
LNEKSSCSPRCISIATGEAAYPLIKELVDETAKKWHNLKVKIFIVKNNFFGSRITVAGLLTGRDLIEQLQTGELGDELLIPATALRREGDLFLDDLSVDDLSRQLNIKVTAVKNSGNDFLSAVLGRQV